MNSGAMYVKETDSKAEVNEQDSQPLVPSKAKEAGESLKEKVKSICGFDHICTGLISLTDINFCIYDIYA